LRGGERVAITLGFDQRKKIHNPKLAKRGREAIPNWRLNSSIGLIAKF